MRIGMGTLGVLLGLLGGLAACDGAEGGVGAGGAGGGPAGPGPDHKGEPPVGATVARIIAGRVDLEDVAVVALTAGGRAFCSGTLVASRTVFTAGHCVAESGLGAEDVAVFFGPRVGGGGVSVPVVDWGAHPDYFVLPDGAPMHDVAYVTLAVDAPVAPLPWASARLPSLVGRRLTMVGYGVTNAELQTGSGVRRAIEQTIVDQDAAFLYYGDGVSGTCQGDSGGPTLLDRQGVRTLVAVTSYGDVTCLLAGANTRVDTHADFLAAHVVGGLPVAVAEPPEAGDDLPVVVEGEPNNGYGSAATSLSAPGVVAAALDPPGDVDYYRVALPAGATLTAALWFDGSADLDVRLTNAGGGQLDAGLAGPGVAERVGWTNGGTSSRVVYARVYRVPWGEPGDADPVAYRLRVTW